MVELGYELELPDRPDLQGVPRQNSIRLPVAAQWRAASNLEHPADYAPRVARRLMSSIHHHVSAHQSPATDRSYRLVAGEHWAVLIEHLGHEGNVRELPSGRIEVTQIRGGGEGEILTVLVTPDQWELVMHRHIGPVPSDYFADLLGPRKDDELFLVLWQGDLERSVREALPPVRPWRPVQPLPGGYWTAHRPPPHRR
ncbi:MAG: hypothetical protein AVDCRST_MAG60-2398 [uncultured Nocardioides sp.]|uniref:Uncharacterized protein n=1 Tax=uncultured Nocardioides sp. TaxID=198441 RepID=A0A6J4PBS4_9ACTN|nr:MAG: hypothetical protein AVDCRST_MAG60-2398 [uncultured Nocardioides sp.]